MEKIKVLFNEGSVEKHLQLLLEFLKLEHATDVPFKRFDIKTRGSLSGFNNEDCSQEMPVFLLYLAQQGQNSLYAGAYFIDGAMKKEAKSYFGAEIYNDAEENAQTVHRALREILTKEHASIILRELDRSRLI